MNLVESNVKNVDSSFYTGKYLKFFPKLKDQGFVTEKNGSLDQKIKVQ